ncbi:unnamed protein product [Schistosoma turkestanicum]|nr:unnamed protein product [Schistosoma turkestanicum]
MIYSFNGFVTFCIMMLTINKQLYELNAAYLPMNYRWTFVPYINEDNEIVPQRVLSPISSLSAIPSMHKRGPELIIPFISGGTPTKKSEIE